MTKFGKNFEVYPPSPASSRKIYPHLKPSVSMNHETNEQSEMMAKFVRIQSFILNHAKINFDLENKKINLDEDYLETKVYPAFCTNFPDVEKRIFDYLKKNLLDQMQIVVNTHAGSSDYKNSQFFKAKNPLKLHKFQNSPHEYCTFAPHRMSHSEELQLFIKEFVKTVIISAVIEDNVRKINNEFERYSFLNLPAKASDFLAWNIDSIYLRDQGAVVGGDFYQDASLANHNPNSSANKKVRLAKTDFFSEGFTSNNAPLNMDGGDIIVDEERKIIFMLGDHEGYSFDGDENFFKSQKNWAASLGYELVLIQRKFSEVKLSDIYHLDIFMNVVGPYVVVPEEDIITDKTRAQIERIYGLENIIYLSKEERETLCANFIAFGPNVLMTSPDTPQSFIDKLNDKGLNVILPPIHLSTASNAGVRCFTQVVPDRFYEAMQDFVAADLSGNVSQAVGSPASKASNQIHNIDS